MFKRGKVYWCKISRPGQKPISKSLGKNKKIAKAIEAKLRSEIYEGKFFDKDKGECLTVRDLLVIYHDRHAKPNKNAKSCENDMFLARQVNQSLGDLFITELGPLHIEEYMAKRREDGVSDVTIHHELKLLRHAYSLAIKNWDLINSTPFDKVKLPKGDNKRTRYLKPDEERLLFEALENEDWFRSLIIIARETGLRLSNICDLTWKQVDLFKRSIEIQRTKNGKPVWIPLSNLVHAELVKLDKVRDLRSNKVFVVDGKCLHRVWVGRRFRRLCQRIGLEDFRFHDLRHDFCSRLVQSGQPLHVVSELAGHQDIKTTQRYAHLSPEVKRQAISALNRLDHDSVGYILATQKKKDLQQKQ